MKKWNARGLENIASLKCIVYEVVKLNITIVVVVVVRLADL